jgi:hypothetical protein
MRRSEEVDANLAVLQRPRIDLVALHDRFVQ